MVGFGQRNSLLIEVEAAGLDQIRAAVALLVDWPLPPPPLLPVAAERHSLSVFVALGANCADQQEIHLDQIAPCNDALAGAFLPQQPQLPQHRHRLLPWKLLGASVACADLGM